MATNGARHIVPLLREKGNRRKMMTIARKVMWIGKATVFSVGVIVTLALILGVAATALAAVPGDPFKLGRNNSIDELSTLVGSVSGALLKVNNEGSGPALDLRVQSGEAPMNVNSPTKVNDLNVDKLDGESADGIGVNGLEQIFSPSDNNSESSKRATAVCPEGKVLVGTGYSISGGKSGDFPNVETDVVLDTLLPNDLSVTAIAFEQEPTSANWSVAARAICATGP